MLSFQRLDIYQCSIQFLALSTRVLATLPKGNAPLADQLRRAALSVPLLLVLGLAHDHQHAEAVDLLARIVAMSTKLCR